MNIYWKIILTRKTFNRIFIGSHCQCCLYKRKPFYSISRLLVLLPFICKSFLAIQAIILPAPATAGSQQWKSIQRSSYSLLSNSALCTSLTDDSELIKVLNGMRQFI